VDEEDDGIRPRFQGALHPVELGPTADEIAATRGGEPVSQACGHSSSVVVGAHSVNPEPFTGPTR
jgi:hypothetical protein